VAHSISVHANVPKGGAEGVLLSMGGVDGGFVFYVQKGKLSHGDNYVADQRFKVQSETAIPEGDHIFSFEFTPTGKADIPKGKGIPGRGKALQLNGDLQITSANGPGCVKSRTDAMILRVNRRSGALDVRLRGGD